MKIAVDCREIIDHPTGIGRILREFFAHSAPADDVFFILIGNQRTDLSGPEFARHEKIIIPERVTFWWDQVLLPSLLRRMKPDLFFSPYYKTPLVSPVPAIISIFDITHFVIDPYPRKILNSLYYKNFIALSALRSRRVFTTSRTTKADLTRYMGVEEDKIDVVHASVSSRFSRQSPESMERVRKKYGIPGRYLFYTGNSRPHKNLARLTAAYNLLPDAIKRQYALVLAGVRTAANAANVKPLGFVDDADLPALYSGADLFVFPSLYEGFGIPPLEAMACGCPVISSNASCMPEILGEACRYFDPLDTAGMARGIAELLGDEAGRNELSEKGRAQAALYTPEKMSRLMLEMFRKAANG